VIAGKSVQAFLDDLAGKSATPGGGSAAAIMGAMGAALVSMVCNLTIGKQGYEAVEDELLAILGESEGWRAKLTDMVRADVEAFDAVMAAYRLPKEGAQAAARAEAIQAALRVATEVPLACARACAAVIALCRPVAEKGNRNAISDAGVGALAAHAALRSAALNVYSNAAAMTDRARAEACVAELEQLLAASAPRVDQVWRLVSGRP
jgi:formiminotetrahydrofolate cyclodeaminase